MATQRAEALPIQPDYWYVTDEQGIKFFKDEIQLSAASWCAGAPRDKLERLVDHLLLFGAIPQAPISLAKQDR